MLRLFPELFSRHRVAPVENYPDELLATLQVGGAGDRARRSDRRAAHARHLQLRLLRALVPGRQARRRAGRRPRPVREGRDRLHAHDPGAEARRRDLPPHRRRLPRSARLPSRFRARRARPDVGLSGRQRDARQRGRHRHRRRQGGLQLHAGDREILSRRGADPEERADLALPRGRASRLRARPPRGAGGEGSARLRRLRHADRPEGRQGARSRPSAPSSKPIAEEFHRAADAGALDLPDLRRGRHRAAPCRPAAVRADRPRPHPHRAGRADARRAARKARWWSIRARAAAPRTPGCWTA